jgi:hypothetical protein
MVSGGAVWHAKRCALLLKRVAATQRHGSVDMRIVISRCKAHQECGQYQCQAGNRTATVVPYMYLLVL